MILDQRNYIHAIKLVFRSHGTGYGNEAGVQ